MRDAEGVGFHFTEERTAATAPKPSRLTRRTLMIAAAGAAALSIFGTWRWIRLRRPAGQPQVRIAGVNDLPPRGYRLFDYPERGRTCILVRRASGEYAAFEQRCTHLRCPVFYSSAHDRIDCPCHHGAFSAADGSVLKGPPTRPLRRVRIQRRGDDWLATAIEPRDDLVPGTDSPS